MNKIAFITDSSSGIGLHEYSDVYVVPMGTRINNKDYTDMVDISSQEFFELLKQYENGATTFQPTPQSFIDTYQKVIDDGYTHVIAIHATSALTGACEQSKSVSRDFDIESTIIDSMTGDYPLRRMVEEGIKAKNNNESYQAIIDKVNDLQNASTLIFYPKNLNQVKNSGRLSRSKALIAGILNIQIIIEFQKGKIVLADKLRTKKKAFNYLINKLKDEITRDNPSKVGVSYTGEHETADSIIKFLKEKFPNKIIEKNPLINVGAVHTGYGTVAIGWINV
ncbi:DegV family protein [Staphylococcus pasteuri]|uniref:DegV family protein n=1 Tax=Staphylococcus pasteuri TaxID=45972 RepID=UPI0012B7849A|nr:DegV family protein [Staphylococcus pasteuri]MCE3021034.1 DegV family protein [Staphylococcus pasteuri]UXR66929.1 DegV family protein [Staphylococcus pasteuri]